MSIRKLQPARLAALLTLGLLASAGTGLAGTAVAAGPPEAPVTETPQAITATSATLAGTLNPKSTAAVSYQFDLNTGKECEHGWAYTGQNLTGEPEVTGEAIKVAALVQDLLPGTTYTVCLLASNAQDESTKGQPISFTTPAKRPFVARQGVSGVTTVGATLEARVNPENEPTTCVFRYGPSPASMTSVPCSPGTLEGYGGEEGREGENGQNDSLAVASLSGLTQGGTYYYQVVTENAAGQTEGAMRTFSTVTLPKVNDQPPTVSHVTRTTVLLSGTLNSESAATTYHFVYVDAAEYEPQAADPYIAGASTIVASAPTPTLLASSGDESVGPLPLSGLRAGTTYHYALVATNEEGTVRGPDYTFTTAAPTPPVVETGGVSEVTATGATITGTVNPRGIESSYEFDLGTDTSYGGGRIFGNAGEDAGTETVVVHLQYLTPDTTYHYRIAATNQDGTSYGADATFTTPAVEAPIAQPAALPLIATPAIAFPTETGIVIKPATKHKAKTKAKGRAPKKHGKSKRGGSGKRKGGKSSMRDKGSGRGAGK
jgi:hypothetical protein